MEEFYLEVPSINREKEVIEYCNELVKYNSDINGIEVLTRILHGYTFHDTLDYSLRLGTEEYAKKLGKAQVKTYLLVRKNDNVVVGASNIRFNYPGGIRKFDGNIGYGIRPTERGKGYSKVLLYLTLLECKKLEFKEVKLVCEKSNIASNKTILSLGGVLKLSQVDPSDKILTNVYSIDLDKINGKKSGKIMYEKVLSSDNILYVKLTESLVNEYLELVNDPEIQELVSTKKKTILLSDELKWIKSKLENNDYVFTMIEKNTNEFIGNVELMDYNGVSAELAISICKKMQNKHYGMEAMKTIIEYAFNELKLSTLNAVVFSNNYRSLHCIEKLGFVKYKVVPNVKQVDDLEVDDVYLKLDYSRQ